MTIDDRPNAPDGGSSQMPPDRQWRDCAETMRRVWCERARRMDRRAWWCLAGALAVLGLASIAVFYGEDFFKRETRYELLQVRKKIKHENDELADINKALKKAKSADLQDVELIGTNGNNLVSVGDNGIIMHSSNRGAEWQRRDSSTDADLHALASASVSGVNRVVAVGRNGTALFSDNGGRRWRAGKTTTDKVFNDVAVADGGRRAIAVGRRGTVHFSENGGESWTLAGVEWKQGDKAAGRTLNAAAFATGSPTKAAAVGDGGLILSSGDGGRNWTQYAHEITEEHLEAMARGGEEYIIAAGRNGAMVVSEDGGTSWSSIGKKDKNRDFSAVAVSADVSTAVAVGRRGVILFQETKGVWKLPNTMPPGFQDDLNAVAIGPDGKTCFAVGEDGSILVSNDGGRKWIYRDGKTRAELNAVAFDGKTAVFAGEKSTILFLDLSGVASPENAQVRVARDESVVAAEVLVLQERRQTLLNNIKSLEQQEKFLISDESDFGSGSVWEIFIKTSSYRISIIIIALFSAQQLLTIGRYNVRLAAFYRARVDAVILASQAELPWSERTDEFEQFVRTLAPDDMDFGRTPRNPTHWMQHMGALLTGRLGRNPGGGPGGAPGTSGGGST